MSNKILLLFQDCVNCGQTKQWFKRQNEVAKKYGIKIVETPFTAPGAKKLILEGDKKGFEALPFFTDGNGKYSRDIADFIRTTEELTVKRAKRKRNTKKVKGRTDEVVPQE